ncbi:hypothetical protein SAMN04487866_12224 [Thermoactinomyces sp. DSM 45891]|uniref:hypothetical protein n=1 Tax=Thermoactinomyces sp. DSM 45891 TaxID=1761907 RepID=UPI0009228311|nr:hypothetical protein [Thermoactinomyces sp. DSM 45891]SFX74928.1 hypothetical protein SAMN04487866_12224 [Thermoactinomyces sp. DSM 45891]
MRLVTCPRCQKAVRTSAPVGNKYAGICSNCVTRDDEMEIREMQAQLILERSKQS